MLQLPDVLLSPKTELDDFSELEAHIWREPHVNPQIIRQQCDYAKEVYAAHSKAKQLVVIGTGGSTLGGKMLSAFGDTPKRVLFAETIDPHSINKVLGRVTLSDTLFLVISKSGSTIETLSLYNFFAQQYMVSDLAKHFLFITDPKESPLRELATKFDIPVAGHPPDIGGRFSVLSIVGLLPALFAGVDIDKLVAGAIEYQNNSMWRRTVAWHLDCHKKGRTIAVMLPYMDRLYYYTYWWRQLWAESLGKKGNFTTPFASIGSVDQHSQLQLWLDGPADKYFTLISASEKDELSIDPTFLPPEVYSYTAGKNTKQLQHALVKGTIHSIQNSNQPVCHMHFDDFGLPELGALIMHCFAEVSALAAILEINPYGQPAVEVGKSKTKELLS